MNISSSSRLTSPTRGSPTPTDIQDTQSSHSDQQAHLSGFRSPREADLASVNQQHAAGLVHQPNHKNGAGGEHRQSLKTEYKSNFKPFDQYVYNELTDSFVKQKSSPATSQHLLNESAGAGAGALRSSNQDLAPSSMSTDAFGASSISPSPALEVGAFEPSNGSDQHHCDATHEPWYKEVMKRNEKANEYRFKSEVGHNSALASDSPPPLDEQQQQLAAGNSSASPVPHSTDDLSSKRAYKFTAHDYKRDHLISTMANNNNFNLPKEQQAHDKLAPTTRRVQTKSSAPSRTGAPGAPSRTLTRTTASSRARSQSSKRQVATETGANATSSTKAAATSKSNQTSPVKSATARVPSARTPLATSRSAAGSRMQRPPTAAARTTTTPRPAAPATNGSLRSTRPATASLASTTRAPASTTKTPASTTRTSAPHTIPRPTTARSKTTSTTRDTTTITTSASTTQAQARPPSKRSTGTLVVTASRTRPTTAAPARNSLSRPLASRSGSTSETASGTPNNAPKSIKSKALADAGEKAAAMAATLATAALVSEGSTSNDTPVKLEEQDKALEFSKSQHELEHVDMNSAIQQIDTRDDNNYYLNEEPNLIITTTETGNMLADEIARAEREAQEATLKARQEKVEQQVNQTELVGVQSEATNLDAVETVAPEEKQAANDAWRPEESVADDLVNGLSGAIVSAEDRFDTNDLSNEPQLAGQTAIDVRDFELNDENDNEEPYSLMPTTFTHAIKQEEPLVSKRFTSETESFVHRESLEDEHLVEPRSDETQVAADDQLDPWTSGAIKPAGDGHGDEDETDFMQEVGLKESDKPLDSEDHSSEALKQSSEDHELAHEESEIIENRTDTEVDVIEDGLKYDQPSPGSEEDGDQKRDETTEDVKQAENIEKAAKTEDTNSFQDKEKADERGELKDPESSTTDEPKGAGEGANEHPGQEAVLAQESFITKTVDSHKLTDDASESAQIEVAREADDEHSKHDDQVSVLIHHIHDQRSVDIDHELEAPKKGLNLEDDLKVSQVHDLLMDDTEEVGVEKYQPKGMNNNELIGLDQAFGSVDNSGHQAAEKGKGDDDGDSLNQESSTVRNELLMNVADLVESETRKKQEMARKSELARQKSDSRSSLTFGQSGEVLLSADQLSEQLVQTANEPSDQQTSRDDDRSSSVSSDDEVVHASETSKETNSSLTQKQVEGVDVMPVQQVSPWQQDNSTGDLVNLGATTPTRDLGGHQENKSASRDDLMTTDNVAEERSEMLVNTPEPRRSLVGNALTENITVTRTQSNTSERLETNPNEFSESSDHFNHRTNLSDEDLMEEEEEQQKLSNHLTNSDDDVILAPRNNKETLLDDCFIAPTASVGSRYNGGAGLSLMAQDDRLEAVESAELADGSSAEIGSESRIDLAVASKMLLPELGAASMLKPKLTSRRDDFDSDDEEAHELGLNPNADPIDLAATLSPSSSVAEDMLRLSREASLASIHVVSAGKTKGDNLSEPAEQQKVDTS